MKYFYTRWLYPLEHPIHLLDSHGIVLDNPKGDEIDDVSRLLRKSYRDQCQGCFPPNAPREFISLHWIVKQFRACFAKSDPHVRLALADHKARDVFRSLARIWIVARYADVPRPQRQAHFVSNKDIDSAARDTAESEQDRRTDYVQNYFALLGSLVADRDNSFLSDGILINSHNYPIIGPVFDEHLLRHTIIFLMVYATAPESKTRSDGSAWLSFPNARGRLISVAGQLSRALDSEQADLLIYVGNILRVVNYETHDTRVRFLLLISLIELLLTHNPDTQRFNVEESIGKQFRLKTAVLVHKDNPEVDLTALKERLKQLYAVRSAIAHGDFKALAKFKTSLSKRRDGTQYFDSIASDARKYLRVVLETFLDDPQFIQFLKES